MIFPTTYKKPVLLIGNGAREAGAAELIYELIKKTHLPVLTSLNAVDMVQDQYRIGFIGTYGNRAANMILQECDLLIAVGIRLGLRQIGHNPQKFAPKAYLIRAEIDQYELSRQVKENEEKHLMDAKEFIQKLLDEPVPDYSKWQEKCFQLRDYLATVDDVLGNLAVKKVGELLPENPVVCVDIGQHMCWVAQSLHLKGEHGRILIGGSYGAMGVGLPYSIGAAIYQKGQPVFCITGDGGLQMNIQELETVSREKLPIKILVFNNHALGKISEIQELSYKKRFAQTTENSGYTIPDFVKIANAYGIKAKSLDSYEELSNCIDWLQDEEPCLVNIQLPEDTKLIPKIEFKSMEILPHLDSTMMKHAMSILQAN